MTVSRTATGGLGRLPIYTLQDAAEFSFSGLLGVRVVLREEFRTPVRLGGINVCVKYPVARSQWHLKAF